MQLWAGWRNAPDDLAKVQIGRFVEQRIARHADGTHERPDGKPAQCASREPRDEEVEVLSIPLELASRSLARVELMNDECRTRRLKLSRPGKTAGNGRQQLVSQ